jgi:diguanylate cyclase (GGDEF)-like protein/PAS domain S-box-containing protein
MFRVFSCLTGEHDWRLVVLAGFVCLLASLVAVSLFHRARATRTRARSRHAWLLLAGAATGCGIWATHFIAMLAYEPSVPVAYNIGLTAASLVVAMALTIAGLSVAMSGPAPWAAPIGGAIVGGGVAGMHYLGMWALEMPGHISWSVDLVLASIVFGAVLAAFALKTAVSRQDMGGIVAAAVLLTLAIVSHHFTAMGAVQIMPDPTLAFSGTGLSPATLALAVAAAAVAVLGMSLIGAIADSFLAARTRQFARQRRELIAESREQLRQQNIRLDTALNNMSQGLCMFNSDEEIVVFNRRFLEMYRLSPQVVKPGCKLRELIRHRKEVGLLDADPDTYYRRIIEDVRQGKTSTVLVKTTAGRIVQAFNQPMPGGGWVTTHEDVTERRHVEEQVNEQKLQLDTALNNMSQGLNMFDASGRLVVCNERYLRMYGLSAEVVKPGCTVGELVQARIDNGTFFAADPQRYTAELLEAMRKREAASTAMDLSDGRTVQVISHPTPDGNGWVVTHEDITERRRTEMERDRSQAFASTVIENVPATIVVKDARTLRYVLFNHAAEEYYGITRKDVIGKVAAEVFGNERAATIEEHDRAMLLTGESQFYDEHPVTTPGGHRRIAATTRMPILDAQGQPQYLLTLVDDRTLRKRAEAQIERLVHHDLLTGLPNRAAFTACVDATIETAAKDGNSFALMCLDFDRFKEVNDVYGHAAGDELLRQVSKRLQAVAGGAFVARLGGDEFVVITTDGEQPGAAETMADRLLAAVNDEMHIDGNSVRVGVSVGIAIFPVDGADSATLIGNADAALYRAKAEGRGTFRFFEAGMDQRLRERRVLQQELRSAIERGELRLHYQPQARIGGRIIGFEALVRWQHPQRGTIPPGTFIPLAEESGLIVEMGEWIMREACRQAASWPNRLQIAINLSPVQFRHGDLPSLVHSVLLETGLPPACLELEITEGVLIDDFSRAVSILRRLKALGVRIAMDDFGTGYSSLSYLQAFPFDKIKIDKAFISNLESNKQSATIIRAVIGLARGLEVPVLAEGVETKEQLAFLAKESCDEVQGYLIGCPLPIEDYAALTGLPRAMRAGAAAG